MSEKFNRDKVDVGVSIALVIIGIVIFFFADNFWEMGTIIPTIALINLVLIMINRYQSSRKPKQTEDVEQIEIPKEQLLESWKFKPDKCYLFIWIVFSVVGDTICFLTEDSWHIGLIISAIGGSALIEILFDWYYFKKKQKKRKVERK